MAAPSLRTFAIRARHTTRAPRPRTHKTFTHNSHNSHSYRSSGSSSNSLHRKQARALPLPTIFIAVAILGSATYLLTPSSKSSSTLNETTFVPYTITARDSVSPSSVLLTISPRQHGSSPPCYLLSQSTAWKYPLWSVEFKQPEVQIARHYTPLPPQDGEDPRDGKLRFYVRAVDGGEMSNYLHRLGVGRDVYLRGPHRGFDVLSRLGACGNVVFLAGGTGVVPGMQVARAVLERDDSSRVKLLWAVRKREEAQGAGIPQPWWKKKLWATQAPAVLTEVDADLGNPSAVARELMRLKAKYGERLHIRLAVDEERTRFTRQDVQSALGGRQGEQSPALGGKGCPFHDQLLHTRASEFEGPRAQCQCQCDGSDRRPGKNLLMVSGPDGFVAHYAGEKIWLGGTLTQGPIDGVAGQLQRRHPSLANDWLVLKL
ncbi:hypothetical protein EsDP_00003484 [Epichloe bromicola]|uniref:FAD-binding FR-type domain-containing protein n=1 Tax=Epichloe bromicola TaxID=79588 RepID=A0ABQ0CNV9_9HYPO